MKIRIYFVVSLILAILGIVGIIIYYSIPNEKPHIFVILADDMGYNDIGYNNHKVITPHLDRLASQSIMFQNNYVQAMCTPSRFALMSGIYPFKAGMSHTVENALKPHCAPLNYKFVPEYLKTKGYKTHHIGKWHLGFCHENCTAIKRGFDESYGFYNGYCGYYNHINVKNGYDFNFNNKIDRSANGTHLMELFDEYTKRTIQNHKPSLPLFMYFAYPTPHTPIESESKFYNMYNESKMSEHRKHYLALMTSMDHSVGNLVSSLKAKGMYHNSIIIFISDNGGEIFGPASNYPYRGSKLSLYEGGVRSTAFVHSPLYGKKQKYVYGITHIIDFAATIIRLSNYDKPLDIDGYDLSDVLSNGADSPRKDVVLNIDLITPSIAGAAGIRIGKWKLLEGSPGLFDGYSREDSYSIQLLNNHIKNYMDIHGSNSSFYEYDDTNKPPHLQLYNLETDPREQNNMAEEFPKKVTELQQALIKYKKQFKIQKTIKIDPRGYPENNGGNWITGWCDINEVNEI